MSSSSLFLEPPRPFFLLLLLLLKTLGGRAFLQDVLQTQEPLKLNVGETLTLHCIVNGIGPLGGVKWHKGTDRSQPPVYDKAASSPPTSRVVRVDPGSDTDYSIHIRDIQPKDAGTYYCVTYNLGFPPMEHESGTGTQVSVAETLVRQPHGPLNVRTGDVLTLACEVTGHVQAGSVRWYKQRGDGQELIFPTSGSNKRVTRKEEGSGTDFTIFIPNVVPEDAAIYFCVKQKGKPGASGEVLENGPGTVVFVDCQQLSFNPGVWAAVGLNKIVVFLLFCLFLFLRKMLSKANQGLPAAAASPRSLQENPAGR